MPTFATRWSQESRPHPNAATGIPLARRSIEGVAGALPAPVVPDPVRPDYETVLGPKRITAVELRRMLGEALRGATSCRLRLRWADGQRAVTADPEEVFRREGTGITAADLLVQYPDGSVLDLDLAGGRCYLAAGGPEARDRVRVVATRYLEVPSRHLAPALLLALSAVAGLLTPVVGWIAHLTLLDSTAAGQGLRSVVLAAWVAIAAFTGLVLARFAAGLRIGRFLVLPALPWYRARPEVLGLLAVAATISVFAAGFVVLGM